MPTTAELSDNDRIMRVAFIDPWTLDEMKAVFEQDRRLRDGVSHPYKIHTFVDVSQTRVRTQNALQTRYSPSFTHRNRGVFAISGANSFVRMMAETAFQLVRYDQVRFFDAEQEALAYLRQIIATEALAVRAIG